MRSILRKGAFQKSELAGWTMVGLVILTMKWAFSKSFLAEESNHLHRVSYVELNWSGWIVLIKKKIQITTGMVWPVSSDK